MISYRDNPTTNRMRPDAELSYAAMLRHANANRNGSSAAPPSLAPPTPPGGGDDGDILYKARAIAVYLFNDDSDRARRRVFHLWTHYRDRNEKAGLFKLKGALCLSKSKWRAFHGI